MIHLKGMDGCGGAPLKVELKEIPVLGIAPANMPPQRRAVNDDVSPLDAHRCNSEKCFEVWRRLRYGHRRVRVGVLFQDGWTSIQCERGVENLNENLRWNSADFGVAI